jgi:AAA family ATP:ADP antiporter
MPEKKHLSSWLNKFWSLIWPIASHEHGKFLPMCALMFFVLFNYSMLRSIKDGLVVVGIGAEAISFLKLYVVLPAAIIAMLVYSRMCNSMSQQKIFYLISGFFAAFLCVFTFFLYPYVDTIHPSKEAIDAYLSVSHRSLHWFIKIGGGWIYAAFYTVAELWGSIMMSLLFWQFANQITKTEEAKRFYSTFGIIGNAGLILAGWVLGISMEDEKATALGLKFATSAIIVGVLLTVCTYWYINRYVLTETRYYDPALQIGAQPKLKLSLPESLKLIFSSKYLGLIAMLVISYGISVNLIEGMWKAKVKEFYVTAESYSAFMGRFQMLQGFASIIFMMIGSNILRHVSWGTAALFTPIMLFVSGSAFCAFLFFDNTLALAVSALFGTTPLVMAVMMGTLQNVLSKATKYSLFDSTKEMSYIPLDAELKTKGKAAVDVIGGRLGKSGGGVIQSTFFILAGGSFAEATPYFAAGFALIMLLWVLAIKALHKEYNAKLSHPEQMRLSAEANIHAHVS